jgi:ribonuclease HII
VVACAVADHPWLATSAWGDSKTITRRRRAEFVRDLGAAGVPFAFGRCAAEEVDSLNILAATLEAMRRALAALEAKIGATAAKVWVDGVSDPKLSRPTELVVKGDAKVACIGAASILAKEERDGFMRRLHERYPAYGFADHSGYGTAQHLAALADQGSCPEHRLSFAPVRQAIIAGRHRRGDDAEEAAADHLQRAGMRILARNWSGRCGELDIVCDNGLELVVVEVRSRADGVDPLETLVGRAKWAKIRKATEELVYRLRLEQRFIRFDVVAVQPEGIRWLEDAWRPG